MLHYERTDINEGINPTENNKRKEGIICHYWFFNHGCKFKDSVYNGCHDLTMLCLSISDITIITVKNVDYHCIIYNISKSEAINLLESTVLENRGYIYKKYCLNFQSIQVFLFFFTFLFSIYKMVDIMDIYKSLNVSIGKW